MAEELKINYVAKHFPDTFNNLRKIRHMAIKKKKKRQVLTKTTGTQTIICV